MTIKIPSSDCFRRLAHGVLVFLLWQAACRNTTALAFRSGFYLARKSPGIPQSHWPNTCCPPKRNPPKANVYLQFRRRSETPSRKTSLGMGLRDLLKRSILGRKDDKDGKNNEQTEGNDESQSVASMSGGAPAASAASPKLESPSTPVGETNQVEQEKPTPPKAERRVVRMAEDPSTGEVNVQKRFGAETVQEKINRVKAGKMTDEEKEAFLRTALSAGDTPLSRQPLLQKKGGVKDDLDAAQRARGKASPFPTDTIIRKSFSLGRGGNNMTTSRDSSSFDSSLDTQKKKREYLDMVTNPDRFRTYKAAPSGGGVSNTKPSSPVYSDVPSDDYEDDDSYFPAPSLSSSRNSQLADTSSSIPPPNMPPMPTDLGARLGAHALASEKIAADLRRQAEEDRREKERLLEEERREQEKRNQEALRQREAELLRREREVAERKRTQEEALRKAEEERKRKEEERLRVMMQAQEEYWAKKLQAERSARQVKASPAVKGAKQGEESPPMPESTTSEDYASPDVFTSAVDEAEQQGTVEHPTVGSPLNDVIRPRTESQPSPWGWPQRTAADILGRNPRKVAGNDSLSDFQAEQARKKADIERTKATQLERLKALNSPIPNRPTTPRGVTPSSGAFQPQYPASASGSRGLGAALSRTTQQSPPSPPQPVKDDSLDDIFPPTTPPTTQRAPNNISGLNDVVRPAATTVGKPAAATPSRPATPSVSTPAAVVKPDFSSKVSSAWAGLGNIAAAQPKKTEEVVGKIEKAETPSTNASKSKGPVIRQQLPFDDEDGIGRDAKGLSIAEVMKRVKSDDGDGSNQQDRSKKWGVDMSRFREK